MGGFLQGALGVIGDRAQEKVREHSAQEKKLKDEQAQVYWDLIKSGRGTPEQVEYAQAQLQKIYGHSKPIKELFGKLAQVTGITHPKKEGGKDGATVAPPPGAKQSPVSTPPFVPGSPTSNQNMAANESQPSATPETPKQPSKPVSPPPSFSSIAGTAYPNQDAESERKHHESIEDEKDKELRLHKYKMEEAAEAAKVKAANPSGRASAVSPISMSAARKMAEKGMVFNAADGTQPLILDDYDDTMMLVPLQQNGKIVGYSPASQHQTHLTFNNQVVTVPTLNQMDANTKGVVQGVSKTGTTSSHETIAVDASGNPIKQTLTSTSTPNTPGKVSPPPGVPSAPGVPSRQSGPSNKQKTQKPQQTQQSQTSKPQASGALPKPAYMTPSMYRQFVERVTPIREAATQVLGDPSQPEFKSLKDYAYLADSKSSRDKIGAAVRLTFDGMEEKNSHDPGFLHLIPGQIVQLVSTKIGMPQWLAGAKAQQLQESIGKLSTEEKQLYNKIMSAYGAIIGLRSLTKAGSSNFSMQKIEQEAPIPGINATTSQQMYDQLANLAEIVYNGYRTLPDSAVKEEKEYYKKQVGELISLASKKKSNGKVNPPPGANKSPATADEFDSWLKKQKK